MTSLFIASLIAYVLAAASIAFGFIALFSGGRDVLTPFAAGVVAGLIFLIVGLVVQGTGSHLKNITDQLVGIRKSLNRPK